MKITLSDHAGFCEGVQRAYDMMEKIVKDPDVKRPIFVLGSLVHNSDVVERIEKMGVRKIQAEEPLQDFFEKNKNTLGTLVITAHGIGPEIYELAKKYQVDLIDTTCPRVIKVQRLAKNFAEKNLQIVIIGERKHKEVVGIFEWGKKKALFIETQEDLQNFNPDLDRKIVVLSQTTQDREFVERAAMEISRRFPNAEIFDSICLATHDRQSEIAELAEKNDVVIVIGDPASSNSNRLFEIAKRINENSYFIRNRNDLNSEWFDSKKTVAVTAGASTPKWVINSVMEMLESL